MTNPLGNEGSWAMAIAVVALSLSRLLWVCSTQARAWFEFLERRR